MRIPGTASTARRVSRAASVLGLCVTLVSGCGVAGDPDPAGADDAGHGITLTIGDFGTFGYKEAGLFDEYMSAHPGITVVEHNVQDENTYYPAFQTRLAAGRGLDDIQAVEVGRIAQVVKQADKFADLTTAEGVDRSAFLPWKWQQATTPDGRTVALGTDIGPLAVCYRKDLFQQAGLPTDRDEVGRLWQGDWARFVEVGRRFQAGAPAGTHFIDSTSGLFNAVVASGSPQYDDEGGRLDYRNSAGVQSAWDLSLGAAQAGISAGLKQFDPQWNQAFANSAFAAVVCPSWMTAIIAGKSGEANRGKWDIAAAPAAGNWGGSFLSVPGAGRHRREAEALAVWLTAPEQQAKVFVRAGNLPSTATALSRPEVQHAALDYFGDAPTGQIYAAAATSVQPAVIGEWDGLVKNCLADTLLSVEQHRRPAAEAWSAATREIDGKVGD
ncbi:ABC transporter substrate-binding protein [Kitasatospora sp. NPDC001660]